MPHKLLCYKLIIYIYLSKMSIQKRLNKQVDRKSSWLRNCEAESRRNQINSSKQIKQAGAEHESNTALKLQAKITYLQQREQYFSYSMRQQFNLRIQYQYSACKQHKIDFQGEQYFRHKMNEQYNRRVQAQFDVAQLKKKINNLEQELHNLNEMIEKKSSKRLSYYRVYNPHGNSCKKNQADDNQKFSQEQQLLILSMQTDMEEINNGIQRINSRSDQLEQKYLKDSREMKEEMAVPLRQM